MAQNKGTANPKFSVGDRVTEKNRKGMFLLSNNSLKDFDKRRTTGIIQDIKVQEDKRGHANFYYYVQWLETGTTNMHHQMRLHLLED